MALVNEWHNGLQGTRATQRSTFTTSSVKKLRADKQMEKWRINACSSGDCVGDVNTDSLHC